MQSYNLQPHNNQPQDQNLNEEYKKDLGLRKMLYKYEHQNQQLRNQIKALTERLQIIMQQKSNNASSGSKQIKKEQNQILSADKSAQGKLQKYWRQQMQFYYKRIQQINSEISQYKDVIDEQKQQEYTKLHNIVKVNDKKIRKIRQKLQKFQKQQQVKQPQINYNNSIKIGNLSQQDYEKQLIQELQNTKKRIRQLQRARNQKAKANRSTHLHIVNLSSKTRQLTAPKRYSSLQHNQIQRQMSPKKMGIWGLQLTPQNFQNTKKQFRQLQQAKTVMLNSIKVENNHLKDKLVDLKNQYIQVSTYANTQINNSMVLSSVRRKTPKKLSVSANKTKEQQTIELPQIPAALGKSAYERKNDKNFVQKKSKTKQWQVTGFKRGVPGLAWNDENCKSPITGINLWFDKFLLGAQFLHTLSQSNQHLHLLPNKKITPIQYRLNQNDYLQNIILIIMNNPPKSDTPKDSIVGIQLHSKNGRKDIFGQKVGSNGTQKFDFGVKTPQKPIYSYGSFTINSKSGVSCVNKLGFVII